MTTTLIVLERLRNWIMPPRPGTVAYDRETVAAAEARWTANNQQKREAGCLCGRPATEVRYMPGNTGSVVAESWTCADHVGVNSWSGISGPGGDVVYTPNFPRCSPCSTCVGRCSTTSKIGEAPYEWHCPNGRDGDYESAAFTRNPHDKPQWMIDRDAG